MNLRYGILDRTSTPNTSSLILAGAAVAVIASQIVRDLRQRRLEVERQFPYGGAVAFRAVFP